MKQRPTRAAFVAALGALAAAGGCDILGVTCTLEARPAIAVTLADAETNGPILSGEVTVVATDGAFADSVRFSAAPANYNVPVSFVHERPGVYTVTIRATGYETWSMEGIRVDADECHVQTRALTARLQPL